MTTARTVVMLAIKSYLAVFLALFSIALFFLFSGALSFQSTHIFTLSGCGVEVSKAFSESGNIEFEFNRVNHQIPEKLIYTSVGLTLSEKTLTELKEISDVLSQYQCEVPFVDLQRGHVLSAGSISDVLTVIWMLLSILGVRYIFKNSIEQKAIDQYRTLWLYPIFGFLGAVAISSLISLYIFTSKAAVDTKMAEIILANVSFFEAVFIAVILVPFIEEVLFRRIVLQLWVNKSWG